MAHEGEHDEPADEHGTAGDAGDDEEMRCYVCNDLLDLVALVLHTAEEELDCDGRCGRVLPPGEARFRCVNDCDFDLCVPCSGVGRQAVIGGQAAVETAVEDDPTPPSPPRVVRAAVAAMPSPTRRRPQLVALGSLLLGFR